MRPRIPKTRNEAPVAGVPVRYGLTTISLVYVSMLLLIEPANGVNGAVRTTYLAFFPFTPIDSSYVAQNQPH